MQTNEQAIEELLFPAPTAEQRAALKLQNKKLLEYSIAGGHTALFKPISRATFRRVQAIQADPDSEENMTEVIVLDTLVYPAREKFEALLEDFPAAAEAVVMDLLGVAKGEAAKRGKRVLPRSSVRALRPVSASPATRSTRSFEVRTPSSPPPARSSSRSSSR